MEEKKNKIVMVKVGKLYITALLLVYEDNCSGWARYSQ